jgi:hypothetical protein
MQKYIKLQALSKIEELGRLWALNYFAKEQQAEAEKPDKVKIDAAEFNMKEAEKQIKWYKSFIKEKK